MTDKMKASDKAKIWIHGAIIEKVSSKGLPSCHVAAYDHDSYDKKHLLGEAISHANGEFSLCIKNLDFLNLVNKKTWEGGANTYLVIKNRFGREGKKLGPFSGPQRFEPMLICIERQPDLERPYSPPPTDPFTNLKAFYGKELDACRKLGINQLGILLREDLEVISRKTNLPISSLEVMRLHTEMSNIKGFDKNSAIALVNAGIKSRGKLTSSPVYVLLEAIGNARKRGVINQNFNPTPAVIYSWIAHAKGFDETTYSKLMNSKRLQDDWQSIVDKIHESTPNVQVLNIRELINPLIRGVTAYKARALMESVGISDLYRLGRLIVDGDRTIDSGVYIAHPKPEYEIPGLKNLQKLLDTDIRTSILKLGGGFKKDGPINILPDSIHVPSAAEASYQTNESVIIASTIEFNGILRIGANINALTIIAEEIHCADFGLISWEGRTILPVDRPSFSKADRGVPDNEPTVYIPTDGDVNGRDGGNGSNGANGDVGFPGDILGLPPDLTIYVQRIIGNLPQILLDGRPGGRGQAGQDGGDGGNGARGKHAASSAVRCTRPAGRGGNGGNGGNGGDGGSGGQGGSGGNLTIVTLDENLRLLPAKLNIDLRGGPGGLRGDAGRGGDGGGAGNGGASEGWCANGSSGDNGNRGRNGRGPLEYPDGYGPDQRFGPKGNAGQLIIQPITQIDWETQLTLPWIVRLQPQKAPVQTTVRIIARNITADILVRIAQQDISTVITPISIDIIAGVLEFLMPTGLEGGQVFIALQIRDGEVVIAESNEEDFIVTPAIHRITTHSKVHEIIGYQGLNQNTISDIINQTKNIEHTLPGTDDDIEGPLVLIGSGFSCGSQIRFGDRNLIPQFIRSDFLYFSLPGWDSNPFDSGGIAGLMSGSELKQVMVINPDNEISNSICVRLDIDIVVRVKAWIVVDEALIGAGTIATVGMPIPERDEKDIRSMFTQGESPDVRWSPHHIHVELIDEIGFAGVSSDYASSFPSPNDYSREEITEVFINRGYFEEGAVNFYFVDDIDDWSTHAYADSFDINPEAPESRTNKAGIVIFEDTPVIHGLSENLERNIAAHEIGHVFGLDHTCEDDPNFDSFFNRPCDEPNDTAFLMCPGTVTIGKIMDVIFEVGINNIGQYITADEGRKARKKARIWHHC